MLQFPLGIGLLLFPSFPLPSIQLLGLAPPYTSSSLLPSPRQPVPASVSKPQPLSSAAAPERKLPFPGFHLQPMKETIFSRDKVRVHLQTATHLSSALSLDQTPGALPTPLRKGTKGSQQNLPTREFPSEQGTGWEGKQSVYFPWSLSR